MPKRTQASHDEHGDDSMPKRRKTDDVTTSSILQSFLIQKITLDETFTEAVLAKALKDATGTKAKGKTGKTASNIKPSSYPAIPHLTRELNLQRRALRKQVNANLEEFSDIFDKAEATDYPQDDEEEEDSDGEDEQMALLKRKLSLDEAVKKLKKTQQALKAGCGHLEVKLAAQQQQLTKTAEVLVHSSKR